MSCRLTFHLGKSRPSEVSAEVAIIPRSPSGCTGHLFTILPCHQPNFLAARVPVCQAGRPMLIHMFSFPKQPLPKEREWSLLSSWWAHGIRAGLRISHLVLRESIFISLAFMFQDHMNWSGRTHSHYPPKAVSTQTKHSEKVMVIYRNRPESEQRNWHCSWGNCQHSRRTKMLWPLRNLIKYVHHTLSPHRA